MLSQVKECRLNTMSKLQNYKFTYNGTVSFTLLEEMRLERENRTAYEDRFQLISPDGTLRLCIEFFTSSKSARELIEELYSLTEHDFILPPCSVTTPTGIDGYFTTYKIGDDCYEECTLDLGGDTRINFWFLYKASKHCNRDLYEQVKNELLDNVKIS